MDIIYERQLVKIESNTYSPRFMISCPEFRYNEIKFAITQQENYKSVYENYYKYSELVLEHESLQVINDFIKQCIEYISRNLFRDTEKRYIYQSNYIHWDLEMEMKSREIQTIYIPEKVKTEILSDISQFMEPKVVARYRELNINHVRMYMFYGAPGTGKTSLIKSLGSHFNKNICYLDLNKRDLDDSELKKCIRNIPSDSILCLEDVDSLFGEDRKSKTSLSFSGFINSFDGFATPDNLIVIMTTNNLNQLDQAVVRRISYFVEFKYSIREQTQQMFDRFFPEYTDRFEEFYKNVESIDVTTNVLEKFFTRYLFQDIIVASKNFSRFANGELKTKINENSKMYI